jgi:threonine aldolase
MFCLSKGLGAPVGSLLVADDDCISECRRIRKMFGGGMRQAGIIAAAGIVALDEVLPTLGDDNRRARRLADGLAPLPGISLDPTTVETNIVFFGLSESSPLDAGVLAVRLADHGVLCHPLGGDSIRMVTHYHISDDDVDRAIEVTSKVLGHG